MRGATALGSATSRTAIQPAPYGSLFTSSGWSASVLLASTTFPATGAKISLTAFTDSTVPIGSPCLTTFPTGGRPAEKTSGHPGFAWALVPTRHRVPSRFAHPRAFVYRTASWGIGLDFLPRL